MEEVSEDVTLLDNAGDAHVQSKVRQDAQKESAYSLKPESGNKMESQEMLIPIDSGYSQDYPREFTDILEGKNLDRCKSNVKLSDQPECSPHCMDDAGVMVEELTVKNHSGSNLAIVGTSNNRARLLPRHSQWQHLYQLGSGSGSGRSCVDTSHKNTNHAMSSGLDNGGYTSFPGSFAGRPGHEDCVEGLEEMKTTDNEGGSISGSIRTKILSKSRFPEYFVKNTLKGKGIIHRGAPLGGLNLECRKPKNANNAGRITLSSDASPQHNAKPVMPQHDAKTVMPQHDAKTVMPQHDAKTVMPQHDATVMPQHDAKTVMPQHDATVMPQHDAKTVMPPLYWKTECKLLGSALDGVSLREWLKAAHHKVSKIDCLCIFRHIVEMVDQSHTRGVLLHDLRPSSFRISATNQVKYFGSFVQGKMSEGLLVKDNPYSDNRLTQKRPLEHGNFSSFSMYSKKQKTIQNTSVLARQQGIWSKPSGHCVYNSAQTPTVDQLEEEWYASPEELNAGCCSAKSNIYSLGVLLFELLGKFDTDGALIAAMSGLRDRILPPNFLAENLREAGFCLWLLHPEPVSRPTTREILEYELINGIPNFSAAEQSIDDEDAESELLLQFLSTLNEQKQRLASKLEEDIRYLESDIEEVNKRHSLDKPLDKSYVSNTLDGRDGVAFHGGYSSLDVHSRVSTMSRTNDERLRKNISQLESAYFSMRSKVHSSENDAAIRTDKDLLKDRENCYLTQKDDDGRNDDCLGAFFDGFCKYSSYSKFEVRGVLRKSGDSNSSSNVICSLSFDRDEDYFAAAGVSKKIRIYDFNALCNGSVDIHYPAVEMFNRSKLSCVCWNSYIRNYLASTDYDGAVKIWDATTGQEVSQYNEHERRAWSVDFSGVHPTRLASGSDDCAVKLWSINEKNCLGTIKNIANVCCVQFSAHSTHLLAFGSADYRTYCFDIRYSKAPWCVLGGHEKTVSYVKFLDSETLVSASTDNTLKLWDLNRTNPSGLSTNACSLTLGGHTNEKNFVGLSVSDGYIACGSETNEVYAYHRSLPMPMTSCKFGSIDPISGRETDDDNGQFVSSVCWRGKSDMLVAANSSGCIKVLQMV